MSFDTDMTLKHQFATTLSPCETSQQCDLCICHIVLYMLCVKVTKLSIKTLLTPARNNHKFKRAAKHSIFALEHCTHKQHTQNSRDATPLTTPSPGLVLPLMQQYNIRTHACTRRNGDHLFAHDKARKTEKRMNINMLRRASLCKFYCFILYSLFFPLKITLWRLLSLQWLSFVCTCIACMGTMEPYTPPFEAFT